MGNSIRHYLCLFFIVTLLFSLSTCLWANNDDALQYRADSARSGYFSGMLGNADKVSSRVVVLIFEAPAMQLNFVDGTTIDIPMKGSLHALDGLTGEILWSIPAPSAIWRDFTISKGTIIHYSWDQNYYAFDVKTGKLKWKREVEGPPGSAAVIVQDGIVHTGVIALNADNGYDVWTLPVRDDFPQTPAFWEGKVFGSNWAANAQNGHVIWTTDLIPACETSPLVIGNLMLAGDGRENLVAIEIETGKEKWKFDADALIYSPSGKKGRVFICTENWNLFGIDAKSGNELWMVTTQAGFFAQTTTDGDRVFARSRDGYLFAIDAQSGGEVWKTLIGETNAIPTAPAIAIGRLYLINDRRIRALDTRSGKVCWEKTFKEPIDWAPPVATD